MNDEMFYARLCGSLTDFMDIEDRQYARRMQMDKQIRKIEKETKKTGKDLKKLEKADKKRDKVCDYGEKMMKKKKK